MFSWENKRVLVTGATGFVGSNLYSRLKELGASVYGTSRTKQSKDIYKLDILNFSQIDNFISKKGIQICFHLAGEALVESGQKDPYSTFKVNLDGALNVLEASRKNGLERIIAASTSHVYGKNKLPYIEEYTPKPSRPYETSKVCIDLISQSYADTFNLPVLIPRFVNIYGPKDTNFTRLIPKTIKSVLSGQNPKMWGGSAKREYLFVNDAVDAYLRLAEMDRKLMEKNRIYNFGTGEIISVKHLIERIVKLSGQKLHIEKLSEEREDEIDIAYVSSDKARRILGWEPKNSLDEGLGNTIAWYKGHIKK